MARKIGIAPENAASCAMYEDERRLGPGCLYGHDRCHRGVLFALLTGVSQLLYGWTLKKCYKRQRLAEQLLDLRKQPDREQRRSAHRQKVILNPNSLHPEQLRPRATELLL